MKQKLYKHLGYFNDNEDIIDVFPSGPIKGDEADLIVQYWKEGYGNFHKIDHPDDDTDLDINDLNPGELVILTTDPLHKYAVRFERGDVIVLRAGKDFHGYFIDIYELRK